MEAVDEERPISLNPESFSMLKLMDSEDEEETERNHPFGENSESGALEDLKDKSLTEKLSVEKNNSVSRESLNSQENSVGSNLKDDLQLPVEVFCFRIDHGTESGKVHILKHGGDPIAEIRWHSAKISCLAILDDETMLASCCDDGKILFFDLISFSILYSVGIKNLKVKSLSFHPEFKINNTFALGTDDPKHPVHICQRSGFFSSVTHSLLDSMDGGLDVCPPAYRISYSADGSLLAWASESGLHVYDCLNNSSVCLLPPPEYLKTREAESFPASFVWNSPSDILVSWERKISLIKIKKIRSEIRSSDGLKRGNRWESLPAVVSEFMLSEDDRYVIGCCSHKETEILLLTLKKCEKNPEIVLLNSNGELIRAIPLPSITQISTSRDVSISSSIHVNFESLCFVALKDELFIIKIQDVDDKVSSLLSLGRFEQALKKARRWSALKILRFHSFENVAMTYLNSLINEEVSDSELRKGVKLIIRHEGSLWSRIVKNLILVDRVTPILKILPIKKKKLSKTEYDDILKHLLYKHPEHFGKMIHDWPTSIYHPKELLKKAEKALKKETDFSIQSFIREGVTALMVANGNYDSAFSSYLTMREDVLQDVKISSSTTKIE